MATISTDILDDICARFLINLPQEERNDLVRVCFQIELCHWFYIDFYCTPDQEESKRSRPCGIREFIRIIFNYCPFLQPEAYRVDQVIEQWRLYKSQVPTYGAILINESCDKVLLVQGFYAKSSWGFPKGKVNEDEEPSKCAIREVKEETGFDVTPLLNEKYFLDRAINETPVRLYLVTGVPEDFKFTPHTRNEIKQIRWFNIDDLPMNKMDTSHSHIGIFPNHFYTVQMFVEDLKKFVARRKRKLSQQQPLANSTPNRSGVATTPGRNGSFHNGNSGQSVSVEQLMTEAANHHQKVSSQFHHSTKKPPIPPGLISSTPVKSPTESMMKRKNKPARQQQRSPRMSASFLPSQSHPHPIISDLLNNQLGQTAGGVVVKRSPTWDNFRLDVVSLLTEMGLKP